MVVDGAKIRALREAEGLGAIDLGKLVGISPQAIHRIEREGKARPSTIQKMAVIFKVERKVLTGGMKK